MQDRKASTPFLRILVMLLTGLTLPLLWPGIFSNLFSTDGFEVDHHDNWPNGLVVLHVGSDVLIGLSYAVIASILAYIVYRNRKFLPFDWVVLSFGLFIIACGFTHLMHVVTRFTPVYYLDTYLRALTAIVSVATAIALPPLIPRVGQILAADQELRRKKQELEESNTLFKQQQREVQHANLQLQEARDWAEFHASLSDLLQTVHDPDTLAEKALQKLGPVLRTENIIAMRITQGRAKLWHAWGKLHPDAVHLIQGEGTSLEKLQVLARVVGSGQAHYSNDYAQETGAQQVLTEPVAVAFEPIQNSEGQVVVLAFTRTSRQQWTTQERELASRAALAIGLALERTELQQQLRTSQQQLLEAQRHAPVAEVTVGLDGKPIRVNPAASRLLGYSEAEFFGLPYEKVIHPEEWDHTLLQIQALMQGETQELNEEKRYLHKDGRVIHVHLHISVIRDGEGRPQQLVVQFSDITERKQAELRWDQAERYSQAQAQISALLEENRSPVKMAREASRILSEFAGLDYASLMEVRQEGVGEVTPLPQSPAAIEAFSKRTATPVLRSPGSLAWQCLEADHPLYIEHYQQRPGTNVFYRDAGTTATAFLPLVPLSSQHSPPLVFMAGWMGGKTTLSLEDWALLDSAVRVIRIAVERQEHLQHLEEAALTDELTRLGNRRAFELQLKQEHARAKRHAEGLTQPAEQKLPTYGKKPALEQLILTTLL